MARRRRGGNRGSASRLLSPDKRVTLPGRQREGRPRRGRPQRLQVAALIARLRRAELALVALLAPERIRGMRFDLDQLVKDVLELRNDAGGEDNGEAVRVPHEGAVDGEAEGDP